METTPKPSAYFLSVCPANICKSRISQRHLRTFEEKYPKDHIENIAKKYESFSFGNSAFTVRFDSQHINYKDSKLMANCFDHVFQKMHDWHSNEEYQQLSFFDSDQPKKVINDKPGDSEYIIIQYPNSSKFEFQNLIQPVRRQKYIYLAAPFSSAATEQYAPVDMQLSFQIDDQNYGVIPLQYRKILTKILNTVQKNTGYNVVLPHKDINNWGNTRYSEEYIMGRISNEIEKAASMVAIPNDSLGVHLEIGIALCRKIPILVFSISGATNDFWMKALAANKNVLLIEVDKIEHIPAELKKDYVVKFLRGEMEKKL